MADKILYIEAPDGISGDMALGALIDLGVDVCDITRELDKVVPGGYSLVPNPFERNGIHGINLEVLVDDFVDLDFYSVRSENFLRFVDREKDKSQKISRSFTERDGSTKSLSSKPSAHGHAHGHGHRHRRYRDIKEMIVKSGITERAKAYALSIFGVIAEAEAAVHMVEKEEVAFHEVGAMDSIIDIVGTSIAIDLLGVEEFYCSAPRDGSGTILCRHGVIPVPVPAVMKMAEDGCIPIVIDSDVNTEMITPTGFGIIKGLGAKFEPRFGIIPEKTGYGFGKRDTGRLGAVRITLGKKSEDYE